MYKIRVNKIDVVEQDGFRAFMYLEPHGHWYALHQRDYFLKEYGCLLPDLEELKPFGEKAKLRILVEGLTFTVVLEDTSWLQFKFHKGFITDLASVPRFFRSVVDNDDSRIVCAALVHDFLFTTHGLPFRETNKLFHEMMLAFGYNRFKARLAYWAVSSVFGLKAWRNQTPKRREHTRKTAEMMMPRPIVIDGIKYDNLTKEV